MTLSYQYNYWQANRIRLRAMRPSDAERWLTEENYDSASVAFLNPGMELPKSAKDAEDFAARYAYFHHRDEVLMFSIETLAGELVGGINLHAMNRKDGTFETGSRIYSAFRGNGYGFEAKVLVLRYAFHEMRFQKYNIRCVATNEPMIRHAKRLGCQPEGRIRRHIYMDGQYQDELIFGLTREEFDGLLERLRGEGFFHAPQAAHGPTGSD